MTSFSAMSLGSAAQIETKILSGEAASDDILSLYRFYCDRKDENNKQRVLTILKNKTLDTRRKPLFIHYGTPDIKVSDIKYECFIDKSVLEGTAKFDVFTLCNLLSLPSVTEVICTKKAAENCPALVDIIGGVCKELKKDFRQIGLERERERERACASLPGLSISGKSRFRRSCSCLRRSPSRRYEADATSDVAFVNRPSFPSPIRRYVRKFLSKPCASSPRRSSRRS